MPPPTGDVEIVLEGCPPQGSAPKISSIVSKWARMGAYRFIFTIKGARFEDCLDDLRDVIQSFIFASFTVREDGEPLGLPRITVRPANPGIEIVEEVT